MLRTKVMDVAENNADKYNRKGNEKTEIKLNKLNPLRCGFVIGLWPGMFALWLGSMWNSLFNEHDSSWFGWLNVLMFGVLVFSFGFLMGLIYSFPRWIRERKNPSNIESTEIPDSETQSEDEN